MPYVICALMMTEAVAVGWALPPGCWAEGREEERAKLQEEEVSSGGMGAMGESFGPGIAAAGETEIGALM